MEIFIFNKSLQERLTDYTNILCNRENIVPASQILAEWAYYIEMVLEPVGWIALWKIPLLTCQEFNVHHPLIVAVEIENVDYMKLTVLARIVSVPEDIDIPEKYHVPLIELYPIKGQENPALDIVSTAECIDKLRFFYQNLWMPWDIDDDETLDWVTNHLESRLRLYFDVERGVVCKKTCNKIKTLIRKGYNLERKLVELDLETFDEDDQKEDVSKSKAYDVLKLHYELEKIKNQMEILENPLTRHVFINNSKKFCSNSIEKRLEGYFVWLGGSLKETAEAVNKIHNFLPTNTYTKISNSLEEVLDICETGDIVLIGNGEHQIKSAGNLEEGGTLRGIDKKESTIICPKEIESGLSLLNFSGEISLENITIDLKDCQAGIIISKGLVKLSNCCITVHDEVIIKLGIIVMPSAKLIAKNTQFTGLGTCLVVHTSGEAVLSSCIFKDCIEGIQLNFKSIMSASDCTFSNCKEYGIRKETNKLNNSTSQSGNPDILRNDKDVSLKNCTFVNNVKGNIQLRPCSSMVIPMKHENMIASY